MMSTKGDKEIGMAPVVVTGEVTSSTKLERNFSFLSCLGMAFAMLNSWTAMAASLSVVLPSGGPISMIWGLVASTCGTFAMCLSLAEACHSFPTSGGQYDWTYCLAPTKWKRSLSFFAGWMACAGWIALVATGSSLGANFITGIISLWREAYEPQRWHTFLIYLAFTIGAFLLNAFAVRLLPMVDRTAFIWSLSGLVVVIITILVCARDDYQPPKEVFATWINETGWPDGMAFILGLLQSTFGLTGFDAISHMIEEMPSPAITAPKVMLLAVGLGSTTSFVFTIALLFSLSNFDLVVGSAAGPLLEIYNQATRSRTGATCLLMFNLLAMAFATQGLMTVASRMVMSFARDRGLGLLSNKLGAIHPTLKVPFWSVSFVSAWTVAFGLIYLGSSVALSAILSSSVVFVQLSYIIPIGLLFWRGESALATEHATYSLGKLRRLINGFALIFAVVTSVCFVFPPAIPVTSTSMSYVVVVLGLVLVMWSATWFFDGRYHFYGPTAMEERLGDGRTRH